MGLPFGLLGSTTLTHVSGGNMTAHRRSTTLVAVGLVAALGFAACGGGGSTTKSKSAASATSPSTAAASAGTVKNDFALAYTGGTSAKADPTKSKVVIGYVNEEGGVPAFPEATAGI